MKKAASQQQQRAQQDALAVLRELQQQERDEQRMAAQEQEDEQDDGPGNGVGQANLSAIQVRENIIRISRLLNSLDLKFFVRFFLCSLCQPDPESLKRAAQEMKPLFSSSSGGLSLDRRKVKNLSNGKESSTAVSLQLDLTSSQLIQHEEEPSQLEIREESHRKGNEDVKGTEKDVQAAQWSIEDNPWLTFSHSSSAESTRPISVPNSSALLKTLETRTTSEVHQLQQQPSKGNKKRKAASSSPPSTAAVSLPSATANGATKKENGKENDKNAPSVPAPAVAAGKEKEKSKAASVARAPLLMQKSQVGPL